MTWSIKYNCSCAFTESHVLAGAYERREAAPGISNVKGMISRRFLHIVSLSVKW